MPKLHAGSLRNVLLIARREYRERVRTRGFLITTIMIPLIMGGFVGGSIFLGSKTPSDTQIAVVSSDTQLALDLQTELERRQQPQLASAPKTPAHPASPAQVKRQARILVTAMDSGPGTRAELDSDLESGDLDGYLWITPAASPTGRPTFIYTSRSSTQASIKNALADALRQALLREQLAHRGVVAAEVDTMLQPVAIVTAQGVPREDHEST